MASTDSEVWKYGFNPAVVIVSFCTPFSIIAQVDHGKTTLTDAFMVLGKLISFNDMGLKRGTDNTEEEINRLEGGIPRPKINLPKEQYIAEMIRRRQALTS